VTGLDVIWLSESKEREDGDEKKRLTIVPKELTDIGNNA
jgi:hypothetical protein